MSAEMPSIWNRLTHRGRLSIKEARGVAAEHGATELTPEHLLLGLLFEDGVSAKLLDRLGTNPADLKRGVESLLPRQKAVDPSDVNDSADVERILECAWNEVKDETNQYLGTEHLLLGLLLAEGSLASRILRWRGITAEAVRQATREVCEEGFKPRPELDRPSSENDDSPDDRFPFTVWWRLTERAANVILFAQDEVLRTRCGSIAPEHLLLGLLRDADTSAGAIFAAFDVDIQKLRDTLENRLPPAVGQISTSLLLTPEARSIIDRVSAEADARGEKFLVTEHLLLGLLAFPELAPAQELLPYGLTYETARDSINTARAARQETEEATQQRKPLGAAGKGGLTMWQRFTERARRIVFFSQEEAARLGESYVGTEHMLLGLVREEDSVAGRILDRLGVPLGRIRAEIERQCTRGHGNLGEDMQLTPRCKRVIDLAYEEARQLNNNYIGTEHLLLGLIREGDGLAARVLVKLGADLERTRREVYAMQEGEHRDHGPLGPLAGSVPESFRGLSASLTNAVKAVQDGVDATHACATLGAACDADLSSFPFDSVAALVEKATVLARNVCADLTDLRAITDLTRVQAETLLKLALFQKKTLKNDKEAHSYTLRGKTLAMVFEKQSLRTRVSFEVGMFQLGGHAIYLQPADISMGKRETVADVARNLDRMVDGIMARVFAHSTILELAEHSRVPVINGLCDREHPCQALCDFLTILEHRGTVAAQKVVYVGDGNNVAHSLLLLGAKLGSHVVIACPKGYEPLPEIVALGEADAAASGGSVMVTNDARAAAEEADVLYTDVWTSMGQEAETQQRLKDFAGYQINAELAALAKPDYLFMHCLPAHRGEEVSAEVADGPNSVIFDQAENRLHAQKAVLSVLL